MKPPCLIALILLLVWVACTPSGKVVEPVESPSAELASVDSLMWLQPDSALVRLLDYFQVCTDGEHTVSTDDTYNRHYAHLLLSELLYKNDSSQTNRAELRQAVAYFDSLMVDTRRAYAQNRAFLDARAHYIDGVGFYEKDSVVQACSEYMKALEVMEESFEIKELTGHKAKFIALTYTHLTTLFSDLYLHEQAIYFGKKSLVYYHRYDAYSQHVAWILNEIGSHYDMMDNYDSAAFYYRKGLMVLPDKNNLIYRDIATLLAFLSYKKDKSPNSSLNQLYHLLSQAESENEYLARCAIIGEIYYHEKQFDSAQVYFNLVFQNTNNENLKRQDAKLLVDVFKAQNREAEIIEYAEFLAPFATIEEDKSTIKSQLEEVYDVYIQQELARKHKQKIMQQTKFSIIVFAGLLNVMLVFFILYRINKKKGQSLEAQMKEEQYAHKIRQKALSGRLKKSNEALRIQKKESSDFAKKMDIQRRQTEWSQLNDFIKEDICNDIVTALRGKQIKREAKSGDYPELHLSEAQLHDLSVAVEQHFCGFEKTLTDLYPKISHNAMLQCLLYLLNLEDVQIAALLSCDYSTVKRRSAKLKQAFGTEKELRQFIRELVL